MNIAEKPSSPKHYRIGQVAEMLDVPTYVLRYWETEFPELKPRKTTSGQRKYTEGDIDLIRKIIALRYVEKLTVTGTRRKLLEQPHTIINQDFKCVLREIKICLQDIMSELR